MQGFRALHAIIVHRPIETVSRNCDSIIPNRDEFAAPECDGFDQVAARDGGDYGHRLMAPANSIARDECVPAAEGDKHAVSKCDRSAVQRLWGRLPGPNEAIR